MQRETFEIENVLTTFTFRRCGDNIFSGHASNLISLCIIMQRYIFGLPAIRRSRSLYYALSFTLWLLAMGELFYIIVARLHYTVDVVLALFLVGEANRGSGDKFEHKIYHLLCMII